MRTTAGSSPRLDRLRNAGAVLAVVVACFSSLPPVTGNASLTLTDGRVLEGREVRRDGDVYLLGLEGGAVIPVPVALVAEVGVRADAAEEAPETQAGPSLPTGLTSAEPRILAGAPVEPPRTEDQLAVFGEPARFQQDIVRSTLGPSYWVPDPDEHNFNPSKWARAPTDPNWQPTSAFDPREDVLAGSRSTWQKGPVDSAWVPVDGWGHSGFSQ